MLTADGVEIAHHLRIWAHDEPATVDLDRPRAHTRSGRLAIHTDAGRTVTITSETATTKHPRTGHTPPRLGPCQWTQACHQTAVRMHPHPLMSPVPVCPTCITAFDPH